MTIRKLIIFLQILILNLIITGCLNTKAKNCQQIIKVTAQVETNAKENLASQNLDNILQVADSFEIASQNILQQKIKDKQLAELSKNLGKIYQEYALVTRNFITAFKNKDQEQAIFYKDEVKRLFSQQQTLVNQINDYCQ